MAISGKTGTITFDAGTLNADNWSLSESNGVIDTTHFGTGGAYDSIDGISSADLTVSGPMLVGQTLPTYGAIAAVVLGNSAGTPSTTVYTGNFLVTKVGYKLSASGRYEYEISGSSTV